MACQNVFKKTHGIGASGRKGRPWPLPVDDLRSVPKYRKPDFQSLKIGFFIGMNFFLFTLIYIYFVGNSVGNFYYETEKGLAKRAKPLILLGDPRGDRTPVTGVRELQHHLDIPGFRGL